MPLYGVVLEREKLRQIEIGTKLEIQFENRHLAPDKNETRDLSIRPLVYVVYTYVTAGRMLFTPKRSSTLALSFWNYFFLNKRTMGNGNFQ